MTKHNSDPLSRREALQKSMWIGSIAASSFWLGAACKKDESKELNCMNTSGLSPEEKQPRTAFQYTDKSANPEQKCENCSLYKPAAPNQCGGCQSIKGPIHPQGYCKLWTKKA